MEDVSRSSQLAVFNVTFFIARWSRIIVTTQCSIEHWRSSRSSVIERCMRVGAGGLLDERRGDGSNARAAELLVDAAEAI